MYKYNFLFSFLYRFDEKDVVMKRNKNSGRSLNEAEVGKSAVGFEIKGGKNEEGGYDVEMHLSKEEYEDLKNKKIPSNFSVQKC